MRKEIPNVNKAITNNLRYKISREVQTKNCL